jgi:hypothetical protein
MMAPPGLSGPARGTFVPASAMSGIQNHQFNTVISNNITSQ